MTFRKEYNNGNGHTPFDLVKCIKKYSTHNNGNTCTQNGMNDGMIFSAQHINGNETAVGWSRCDANLHLFIYLSNFLCEQASERAHTHNIHAGVTFMKAANCSSNGQPTKQHTTTRSGCTDIQTGSAFASTCTWYSANGMATTLCARAEAHQKDKEKENTLCMLCLWQVFFFMYGTFHPISAL